MTSEQYAKIAKVALVIPLLLGLMTIIELALPLQKMTEVVTYKHTSSGKLNTTTYSVDFENLNDQFTPTIYDAVHEGDTVTLEVLYVSKEVKTIQLPNSKVALENDTNEVYFQLAISIALVVFSGYFLRRNYLTSKNYRYIIILCLISVGMLIRIIKLNC